MKEVLLCRTRQMTKEDMAAMGQRIKEARIAAGVKQVELAEYFAIGKNEMYRIEAGTRPCKIFIHTQWFFELLRYSCFMYLNECTNRKTESKIYLK